MKEFENFISSSKIDEEYHKKVFEDNLFEKLKNEIYWICLLIFRCSTTNYLENINRNIDV